MLEVRVFAGEQPAIAERLLEAPHATRAVNCLLDNGNLRALNAPQDEAVQPALAPNAQSLFLYYGDKWFSWTDPVNVVRSPIRQDDYDRVYISGLDVPRYTRNDIATGAGVMPVTTYKLGVPSPSNAPGVGYSPPAENTEALDDETRYYLCTFVTSSGEESGPSPVSIKVVVQEPATDTVTITIPGLAVNDRNITKVNIYRSATGGDDAGYFLIGTVDFGTATFEDDPAVVSLGPTLATDGFGLPPDDMHSLIAMKGGMLVGASGQTVCPSEAYLPYAYKQANQQVANAPIVAMAPLPSGAIVATEAYPELLTGFSPDTLALERFELSQACVSARSMVDMGTMAIYASPDGLVAASVQGAQLITEGMWHREQWQALNPASIHAYHHEGQYIAFYDAGVENKGGFIFDPKRKDITYLDFYADTGYRDLASDALYLLIDGNLARYRSGGKLTYTWRSKVFDTPPLAYCLYRIKHKTGSDLTNTTVSILTEDGEVFSEPLTTDDWGYLPPGLYRQWQIEVHSTEEVEAVLLGNSLEELGV